MTVTVYASQLKDQAAFKAEVEAFAAKLLAHNMTRGKEPRPTAHPLVEACVKRVFQGRNKPDAYVADYVIEDDTPKQEEVMPEQAAEVPFAHKIQMAVQAIHMAEAAAREKICPQLKVRLLNTQYGMAMAKPEADRTAEDNDLIASFQDMVTKTNAIALKGAEAEADLVNQTPDTIDSWQPPTFE